MSIAVRVFCFMSLFVLLAACAEDTTPTVSPAPTDPPVATTSTSNILPTPTATRGPLVLTPLVTPGLRAAPVDCIGKPRPRLIVGRYGRVSNEDPTPLNVRRAPNTDDDPVARLDVMETFFVLEGPECGIDYTWYRVRRGDGLEGWIAEGDAGLYYVEPFPPE